MASLLICDTEINVNCSVYLTEDETCSILTDATLITCEIANTGSIIIHRIKNNQSYYTLTDTGSERVLSRIM